MPADIYCRLSRDATGEGLAVARQEQDCRRLCADRGWEVGVVHVDNDVSASGKVRRPGYEALLGRIRTGGTKAVVVWHPDRLHRHPRELEDFVALIEDTGCQVATVTAGDWDLATAEGRLVARITGAVARKEWEDKQRRALRKHAELRERGLPGGPAGFGVDSRGRVVPAEARVVRRAAKRVLDGQGLAAVAAWLNTGAGPFPPSGKWDTTSLRRVLTAGRVAGLREHQGRIVGPAAWEPIIDRVTWERLRDVLDRGVSPARSYLLSGVLVCECGHPMVGSVRYDRKSRPVPSYLCAPNRGGCGARVNAEGAEATVEARMAAAMTDGTLTVPDAPSDDEDVAALIAAEHDKLAGYAAMLDRGDLELVEWRTLRGAVLARLDDLQARVSAEAQVDRTRLLLSSSWDALDFADKRELLARFVTVTCRRRVFSGPRFDPDRLSVTWHS